MKLVGRIPVEPLDDARMTNIERQIVIGAAEVAAHPRSAPRRGLGLVFASVAVAAVVAGVVGFRLGGTPSAPVIAEAPPLRIDTTTEPATLDLGDARLASDPSTVFVVTRPAGGVLIEMTRGRVELEVGKRGDRPPLIVRAGDTDVVVIGTRFSVDYGDGTGAVDVRVTEGVVEVVRHQQRARVAAGSAWQTTRGTIAVADAGPVMTRPHRAASDATDATGGAIAIATPDGTPPSTVGPDGVAAGGTHGTGGYEIEMGTAPDVLRDRTGQVPEAQTPTTSTTGGTTTTAGTGTRTPTTTTTRTPTPLDDPKDPGRNLKKMIRAQRVMPAMDVGETVAATAVSKYYAIIREQRGEEESRAFYSIAVTQHTALGRSEEALKTLDGYFRRFGRGKIYPEYAPSLWLRLRIVCLRTIDDRCRQAATAYLRAESGTPAAAVAELITLSD